MKFNFSPFIFSTLFFLAIGLSSASAQPKKAVNLDGWKQCVDTHWKGTTFPFYSTDLKPKENCLPDTLYSWKNIEYMKSTIEKTKSGDAFFEYPFIPYTLFAWSTALGSFGYGDTLFRFKIKPETHFKALLFDSKTNYKRNCKSFKEEYGEEIHSTVFVARLAWNPQYYEYIICSAQVIESYSFGTDEILEEVLNEKAWIETHSRDDYFTLHPYIPAPWLSKKPEVKFDGGSWGLEELSRRIQILESYIKSEFGGVFVSPDAAASSKEEHYNTEKPNYFNID